MTPAVLKRSLVIAGHKTSVSLEDRFWHAFRRIARERGLTLSELAGEIDRGRGSLKLTSAIRLFVMRDLTNRLAQAVLKQAA